MSDQERLRAIAEREQQATTGPWAWESVAEQSNEYAVGTAWDTATDQPISGLIVRTDDPETDNWLEDRVLVRDSMGLGEGNMADAAFIAHAREDVPYLLSLVARQAQEIESLQAFRATALQAELERAQEIQDLRTERDEAKSAFEHAQKNYLNEQACRVANQGAVRNLSSSRDALREALKGAAMTCVSKPGDRRVVIYFGDDLKRAQDCLKVLVSRDLLAETPTETTL